MIGFADTIAILSLNMTLALVNAGQVSGTFPITGATVATPIAITSPAHGVPLGRTVHAVVQNVTGTVEANGLWELTPTDPNTFTLGSYNPDGTPLASVGVHAYTGGGVASYAFADYRALLGRRWIAQNSAVASPRIVFIPTVDRSLWDFFPYGGQGPAPLQSRGTGEQQVQTLQPLQGTKYITFEVHITGGVDPPDPDHEDFSAVELLEDVLFVQLFDMLTPPVFKVVGHMWPSQSTEAGSMTQRGQKSVLLLQIARPIARIPAAEFVPIGTSIVFTVEPEGSPADATTIDIPGS